MRKIASIKLPCQTWYGKKMLNMTLTVQIPHPTQAKVKFPTHRVQVMVKCPG